MRSCFGPLLLLLVAVGCDVFDPELYLQGQIELADQCLDESSVPRIQPMNDFQIVDTFALRADISPRSCIDNEAAGNDGFFAVEMTAGEKWHFHVRGMEGSTRNPSVYILDSACDDRSCAGGIDLCDDINEHLTFISPSTGLFFVGIDDRNSGGGTYEVLAVRPVCGDGEKEHSEGCDDGNTDSGDGCDDFCRLEIDGTEAEANDDFTASNDLFPNGLPGTAVVTTADIGQCDVDYYVVTVPEGGSVTATVLDRTGAPCGITEPVGLTLLDSNLAERVRGTARAPNACPSIDATDTGAQGLPAGEYYVRIEGQQISPGRFVDYQLQVEVAVP